jgi:hypothetical protein
MNRKTVFEVDFVPFLRSLYLDALSIYRRDIGVMVNAADSFVKRSTAKSQPRKLREGSA